MSAEPIDEKAIFNIARRLGSRDAQADYLAQVCQGDPEVRQRVLDLLRVHEQDQSFLESPAIAASDTVGPVERPGSQIGPYALRHVIGEGGMGVVYLAEQREPVSRRVALKIIKPGLDTRQVIARFEAERQALSLMDHPNIARVLDAGATESGRSYFVMELVQGQPITQYCDERRLTPRQRLEVLLPVCQAIQHAHQKGIIHRDIKPTNVLVAEYDQQPVPKVIDFGVAKAVNQAAAGTTTFTGFGQIIGTLEYMSPEQARGSANDVDTRSDVYALGVLLYELLTGTTPFEKDRLRSADWDEILRIIREEEPPRPSTRLSACRESLPAISARRQTDPATLTRLVQGELDWIVMKALDKDRNRRYETASSLALDLQRYLNDEPVVACPPSAAYRFRKFVRRNRRAVATLALLGVVLVTALGAVAGTIGWAIRNRSAIEQDVARDRIARQKALEQKVQEALEESQDWYARDKLPESLATLKRAEGLLASGDARQDLHDQARQWRTDLDMVVRLEDIRLKRVLVRVSKESFDANQAYQAAFRDYGVVLDPTRPSVAAESLRVSRIKDHLVFGMEDWVVALKTLSSARGNNLLAVLRRADPDPWRNRLRGLVETRDRTALEQLAQSGEFLSQSPATVDLLATTLVQLGSQAVAVDVLRQAQRRHPDDFWLNFSLAGLVESNRSGEGMAYFRAALALRPRHVEVHWRLGQALRQQGQLDEAEAVYREALRLWPKDRTLRLHLGSALLDGLKLVEAESLYRESLKDHGEYHEFRIGLGQALRGQGKAAEAEAEYREAVRHSPDFYRTHGELARFLEAQGRFPEAEVEFREAVRLEPASLQHHLELGRLLQSSGKLDEAEAAFQEAIRRAPASAGPRQMLEGVLRLKELSKEEVELREAARLNPDNVVVRQKLGNLLFNAGNLNDAEHELLEVVRLQPVNVVAHGVLAQIHTRRGEWDKAGAAFARTLELSPENPYAWHQCGVVRLQSGDVAAYQSTCRQLLERYGPAGRPNFADLLALTCLLGEGALSHPEQVRKLIDRALAGSEQQRVGAQVAKALLDHRTGRSAETVAGLERLMSSTPASRSNPRVYFVLSLAQRRLGNEVEARKALDRGRAILWLRPRPVIPHGFDLLCSQILGREAERLLKPDTAVESAAK